MSAPAADRPRGRASWDDLLALDLRVGRVLEVRPNEGARKPAYVLRIDFGPQGVKTSSAQITDLYAPSDLTGRLVVCALGFPPKRIAGVRSEVLVLGALAPDGVVLLAPDRAVPPGTPVA